MGDNETKYYKAVAERMNDKNIEEILMRSGMILRKKVEERERLKEALEKVNLAFKRYKNSLLNKEDDK